MLYQFSVGVVEPSHHDFTHAVEQLVTESEVFIPMLTKLWNANGWLSPRTP